MRFGLKTKLVKLKPKVDESIKKNHERDTHPVTKFPTEWFDINMATIRWIKNKEYHE